MGRIFFRYFESNPYQFTFPVFQFIQYHLNHTIQVIGHVIIPKPQHFIPLIVKITRSEIIIIFLIKMLAAIQFYDQFQAKGTEVCNILTNGMLPSKIETL